MYHCYTCKKKYFRALGGRGWAHLRAGHGDARRGTAQGLQVLPAVGGLQKQQPVC